MRTKDRNYHLRPCQGNPNNCPNISSYSSLSYVLKTARLGSLVERVKTLVPMVPQAIGYDKELPFGKPKPFVKPTYQVVL